MVKASKCFGVLYNDIIPMKLNGNLYRTIKILTMLCGWEC